MTPRTMTKPRLGLSREQLVAYRRRVQALDERLPAGAASLRKVAWAGLQDSMPRAALLSIHARVAGTKPSSWEDPSLVQVWGPRFQAYVVPKPDAALFTLGRFPDDARGRRVAEDLAARLATFLRGRTMRYDEAGDGLGVPPNRLRYATTTGTVRIRWEGARRPMIWSVPAPYTTAIEARRELARRYLHVFVATTPDAFAQWAGIGAAQGRVAFDALGDALTAVRTPVGDQWILADDEPTFRETTGRSAPARLLPSGDTFFLLQRRDRELLVPDARLRGQLWTSRVWPGAVLVRGDIVGTWRRAGPVVDIQAWRPLDARDRKAVEAEAASMPLPDLKSDISVHWDGHS
jgi:hypothetical protein